MKIKEEQLKTIQEQQTKLNDLLNQQTKLNDLLNKVGVLEANKHGLLHEMAGVNQEIEEFKQELEKEYGAININLEDGTYTEISKEEEETPVAAV